MPNRGMIKWRAFDSVIPTTKLLYELDCKRKQIKKPLLSEEQIKEIEEKILEAYHTQIEALFSYYTKGMIAQIKSTILKIDCTNKKIIFQNHQTIYFEQILQVLF